MRILIAGIGNIFSKDDGCGSYVAQALQGCINGVDIIDFGTGGLQIIDKMLEYDFIIFIDAGDIEKDVQMLEINENALDSDELVQTVLTMSLGSSHGITLDDILTIFKIRKFSGKIIFILCKPYSLDLGLGLTEQCKENAIKTIRELNKFLRENFEIAIDTNKAEKNLEKILEKIT
ncbi:hydrogenase maturation protease [Acidianus manzaensis]|uniref:Hydrogenase maturation protease n=1 Tax=Acidianus manzaensis TaxID=282676 RepID=A0A1W6JYL1_9CREN|nr:hydrogenase maturation protease [Acidianus manzaensis]ARM75353.1 hypothetical protein B6F84_04450 [Acidianus manzaensis]